MLTREQRLLRLISLSLIYFFNHFTFELFICFCFMCALPPSVSVSVSLSLSLSHTHTHTRTHTHTHTHTLGLPPFSPHSTPAQAAEEDHRRWSVCPPRPAGLHVGSASPVEHPPRAWLFVELAGGGGPVCTKQLIQPLLLRA